MYIFLIVLGNTILFIVVCSFLGGCIVTAIQYLAEWNWRRKQKRNIILR